MLELDNVDTTSVLPLSVENDTAPTDVLAVVRVLKRLVSFAMGGADANVPYREEPTRVDTPTVLTNNELPFSVE
jgi:hypothetical protein